MTTDTAEMNKQIVTRLYAAFAAVDRDGLTSLLAPDFRAHGMPPGCSPDADGLVQSAVLLHAGLQDCRNEIEDLIAEGDRVAVRYTTRAVHGGTLFGIPPSGRTVTLTGIEVYRVVDGKVAELWGAADTSGLVAAEEGEDAAVPASA
ncbi:ester cyclase [Geodermatophilus sp. URMC 64]